MTPDRTQKRTFSTLLEIIARLNHTFSPADFCDTLASVMADVVGCDDITLVEINSDECVVLYSARIPNLTARLRPPQVDGGLVERIAARTPQDRVGVVLENESLLIEGKECPVVNVWKLGSGDSFVGYVLFHGPSVVDNPALLDDIAPELRRIASTSFFKLMDRERIQEKLDLYQAKLHAINEVGEIMGSLDLDWLLTKLMELSLYIVGAEIGSVILAPRDGDELASDGGGVRNPVEWGLPVELARCFRDAEGNVVYERVMETKDPVLAHELGGESGIHIVEQALRVQSYLCVPLVSKGKCLGVINLVSSDSGSVGFSTLDLDILMTISGLTATAIENAILYADSVEKERYAQNLSIARSIQARMYPSSAPEVDGLDIAWISRSCDETGGDYFDFVKDGCGNLTVMVGDVSGHGIGAALLMASARAGLRAIISPCDTVSLSDLFARLNDQLEQDMEIERFMTLFVGSIDIETREMSFVNAGHDAPCVYRAATGEVEELGSTGMPLGLFAGNEYGTLTCPALQPGDVLIMTTDGVWEVKNPEGKLLGKPRFNEMFRQVATLEAAAMSEALLNEVRAYTHDEPFNDDVTMVVVRAC